MPRSEISQKARKSSSVSNRYTDNYERPRCTLCNKGRSSRHYETARGVCSRPECALYLKALSNQVIVNNPITIEIHHYFHQEFCSGLNSFL